MFQSIQMIVWPLVLATSVLAAEPAAVNVLDHAHSIINGDLSVVDYQGVRLLIASAPQGVAIQSSMDLLHHQRLINPYTQIVSMVTALHPSPTEAYNMGLGGGALSHFHLAQYPKSRVDSVELDSSVVQLAKKDFFVIDPRHAILEGDGFETLALQKKKYDIIWMDQYTPKEGPKATMSAQYLQILRDHLKPDGILIVHLGRAKSSKTFSETVRNYRSGFSHTIRIEGPAPSQAGFDPAPALNAVSYDKKPHKEAGVNLPEHVVAVSNNGALTCSRFWETAQKWTKEKLIDIQWPEQSHASSCEDLTQ